MKTSGLTLLLSAFLIGGFGPSALGDESARQGARAGASETNRPAAISQAEAQIRELDQMQAKAWVARDRAALERLWSPEFVLNAPSNQILKREDVFREMKTPRLSGGEASFKRTVERVAPFGDIMISMGVEHYVRKNGPDAGVERTQRYTNVWRREGDTWRMIARHADVLSARARPSMVVNVTVPCSDSPVREVDERIAPRLAAALGELPRAARVEISSVAGRCSAAIYFRPDSDSAAAMHGVREWLPVIVPKLPADCRDLLIGRGSADDLPLFWIALRGEKLSPMEITEVANGLRNRLMRIPRAADVRTVGATNRRLVLRLDSRMLAKFSATAGDVRRAFVNSFKGEFARRATLDPQELSTVVIRVRDGVPVRARDVAGIAQTAIADGFAMIGAGESVLVAIVAEPGEIPAAAVEKELARLRTTLPVDVRVSMAADLSRGRCCVAQAQLPLGATAEQMRRSAEQVAEAIRGMPGNPEAIVFSSGEGMFQALVPPGRHQITAPDLRQRLAGLPGVGIRICEVGGDVSLAAFPVRIGLVGPDPAVLRRWGNAVAARIRAEGHALDPEVFPGADTPGFEIELNREKAAALGVAAGDVAEAIHLATTSSITVPHGNGQTLEFRLDGASSIQDRLSTLSVHNAAGELLPLARVVEARGVNEPSAIYRVGAEHAVRISAAPPPGTAVAQAVAKCVAAAGVESDELRLPEDYRIIDMTSTVE